jgi:hypothetical protein
LVLLRLQSCIQRNALAKAQKATQLIAKLRQRFEQQIRAHVLMSMIHKYIVSRHKMSLQLLEENQQRFLCIEAPQFSWFSRPEG